MSKTTLSYLNYNPTPTVSHKHSMTDKKYHPSKTVNKATFKSQNIFFYLCEL
jgi:hypothetical protein